MSTEEFSAVPKTNPKPFQNSNKTRAGASVSLNYVSKSDDEHGKCKRDFARKGIVLIFLFFFLTLSGGCFDFLKKWYPRNYELILH